MDKTTGFEDLDVWKHGLELTVQIYKITASFPQSEIYGLTSQVRRASASISANIAEGYERRNKSEKAQFYKVSYGSLLEVKNIHYLANKLDFINEDRLDSLLKNVVIIQKELNALIGSMSK